MNIFTKGSFKWWQISLLKISVLAVGIAIGANWPQIFAEYTTTLIVIGIILGIYLTYVWFK